MGVFSRTMLMLTMAWLVGLIVTFVFLSADPEPGWRDKFVAERNARRAIAYRYTDIKGGSVAESGHDKLDNKRSQELQLDAESRGNAPLGEGTGGSTEPLPGAKVRNSDSLIAIEVQAGEAQQANFGAARQAAEMAITELNAAIAGANRDRRKESNRLAQVRDDARLFASEMYSYSFLIAQFQQKVFNLDYEIQRVMIERDAIVSELAQVRNDLGRLDGQQAALEDQYWKTTLDYERTVKVLSQYMAVDRDLARLADMAGRFLRGKVIGVGSDPRDGVVSISIGQNEGVQPNQVFTIHRGERLVAKMRVEVVRDNVAVGRLLPEFIGKEIVMENDSVKSAETFGGATSEVRRG